jgi:hypothetical protein
VVYKREDCKACLISLDQSCDNSKINSTNKILTFSPVLILIEISYCYVIQDQRCHGLYPEHMFKSNFKINFKNNFKSMMWRDMARPSSES